jgi:hypothetical protein
MNGRCKDCASARIHDLGLYCGHPKLDGKNDPIPVDGALGDAGEEYAINIVVGPEFGCIHFEQNLEFHNR